MVDLIGETTSFDQVEVSREDKKKAIEEGIESVLTPGQRESLRVFVQVIRNRLLEVRIHSTIEER